MKYLTAVVALAHLAHLSIKISGILLLVTGNLGIITDSDRKLYLNLKYYIKL